MDRQINGRVLKIEKTYTSSFGKWVLRGIINSQWEKMNDSVGLVSTKTTNWIWPHILQNKFQINQSIECTRFDHNTISVGQKLSDIGDFIWFT